MSGPVHVIGATGRSGAALCRALVADGAKVVPLVRDAAKWRALGLPGTPRVADLADTAALRTALADARRVVSTSVARYTQAILEAAPTDARLVLLGTTRKDARETDEFGRGAQQGEEALLGSGRSGVMLHATMIYGAPGEQNVRRLAALLARLPVLPLPGGGRHLVQPIHQDDVTRAIRAALAIDWDGPHALVIAGPTPLPYADFARAVARAAGLRHPLIVPVPVSALLIAARLAALVPSLPSIRPAEIRRLAEDKAFDIGPMVQSLGFTPMSLEQGLARTFAGTA